MVQNTEQYLRDRELNQFVLIESFVNTISKGGQEVTLDLIESFTHKDGRKQKLKYSICSDSYRPQCFARVHVWDPSGNEWHHVYSIPPSLMKTEEKLYYLPNSDRISFGYFEKDFSTLRHTALKIVF